MKKLYILSFLALACLNSSLHCMKTVTLKNGGKITEAELDATMIVLENLMKENLLALYDLVKLCRNKNYEPWHQETLEKYGLFPVNDRARNVVLSSFVGKRIQYVDPVADDSIENEK